MKNYLKILLTILILIFSMTACAIPHLVPREATTPKDTTPVSTKSDLIEFTEIDIEAAGPIFLVQGDSHSIQIDGPKTVVDDITFEVSNGVLLVKHSRNIWDWISEHGYPTITITFENLSRFVFEGGSDLVANDIRSSDLSIVIQGGAKFEMLNLNVNSLDMVIEGGADIEVSGVAGTQTLKFAGGTNYDAGDLQSTSVSLRMDGAASATVWAKETLELNLIGAYDVKYYGSPSITQTIQGVGNIEGLGEK